MKRRIHENVLQLASININNLYSRGGASLVPNSFCSRITSPNIAARVIKKELYSAARNNESLNRWCGPHRAAISTSWSQSGENR